jgi:hypothetical protein
MKKILFLLISVVACCIITGCSSFDFKTSGYYTSQMTHSIKKPVIMEFNLSGGDLSADTTNNVQAKLAGLKKYKFFSKYNQGGHYVFRELNETGSLALKESNEKNNVQPQYNLNITFSPKKIRKGRGAVRNFIYSCDTYFSLHKENINIAAGSDTARRGVVQRRSFSKVSEGQTSDDQANRNDMIQKSFNRVLAQIYNAVPWSAVVVSGFDKSFIINQGKNGVAVVETPIVMLYKDNNTFIPVACGKVSAVHDKTTNIEITEWADSPIRAAIENDINFVKKNKGKLFIMSDKVNREFFNK